MTDISKKWACTHYRHHTFPHPRPLHKYTAYAYKYVNRGVWACVCIVYHIYIYIYIYASGAGVSEGGMLTFLVLLPLHVATLHRCLVVLLRCIHEGVGWGGHVNKEQIVFSSMWCWQCWRYVNLNLHTHLQQKTISRPKRLLWKERKKTVNMPQWNESKTHTKHEFCQILAQEFGTTRVAEMFVSLWRKWFFLEKRCFYEHGFQSAGIYVCIAQKKSMCLTCDKEWSWSIMKPYASSYFM